MKKNKMMRIASVLLVAVLLSTCAISGTFAKYVTTADAQDSARVARWGVTLTVTNDSIFFSDSYTSNNGITVNTSSIGTNLVAPGTSSSENGGTTRFVVAGTPEVAVEITAQINQLTAKDVYLKAGTYSDLTTESTTDTFTLQDDYYPIKWTLQMIDNQDITTTVVDGEKLSDIIAYFTTFTSQNTNVAPNTNLATTFILDWEWSDFENNNAADTLLGQLALGTVNGVNSENYCTDIAYTLNVTVEQVD